MPIKVLIVDDDQGLLDTMSVIFESRGHQAVIVDDGYKAVEAVKNQKFNVVLMDIKMPGIDGVETFRQIKKVSPETTVIMMTGESVEELVKEALAEGAYTVVYKPFNIGELIEIIEKAVIKKKVIIVSDEQIKDFNEIENMLKKQGRCVAQVKNETEAVQGLTSDKFEIALISVKTLNMDGLKTLGELRKKNTQIGMIMLSGYSQDEFIDKCMKQGIDAYLHKPFDIKKFVRAAEEAHAKGGTGENEKILLVEDDENLREMLNIILERAGYNMFAVVDGSSALEIAEKNFINLALLDFRLPDMTGLDIAKRLKEISFDTSIILMTAHASLEMAVEAIKQEVDEYLIKPVDPGLLKRSIKRCLEKQRLIIENRKLVEDLRTANEDLKKLDELKSYFLSMVSHELCTPLSTIGGYTSLLLSEKEKLNDEQKDFVETIKSEGERLGDIINDLVDLSRIEAGKLNMKFKSCPTGIIIESVGKALKFKLDEKNIKLKVRIPDSLPDITADSARIQQVVTNLLTNAIKFTPANGEISVHVGLNKDKLKVEVLDSGKGIEAEDIPKIFNRFYQVEKWRAGKREGLGLGMAIAREIIQAHKGEIGVESEGKGRGSKFWFNLPISSDELFTEDE